MRRWHGLFGSMGFPARACFLRAASCARAGKPMIFGAAVLTVIIATVVAQTGGFRMRGMGRGNRGGARQEPGDRRGVPEWTSDQRFKSDLFTFVRIRYSDGYGRGWGGYYGRGGGRWATDYPDSDLNFS